MKINKVPRNKLRVSSNVLENTKSTTSCGVLNPKQSKFQIYKDMSEDVYKLVLKDLANKLLWLEEQNFKNSRKHAIKDDLIKRTMNKLYNIYFNLSKRIS